MALKTISKGLTLQIPKKGATNWADDIEQYCFDKISEHNHDGSTKGSTINTANIKSDQLQARGEVSLSNSAAHTLLKKVATDTDSILTLSAGTSAKIEYRLKNPDQTIVQCGNLEICVANSSSNAYILQDFIGEDIDDLTDTEFEFAIDSNYELTYKYSTSSDSSPLQNGGTTDVLQMMYIIKKLGE
ncbi:MAG: hypothetical protein CMG00_06130 [Candidatus Marinimicrobia bacterium]|nr:hypothetical protein [Candidatus Neomarinimicrobiota bacterium]|tara:strand:+ start:1434 stop:1994 length:561 start_codon:yes stop_codon:yes gene_type:complete